MQIMQGAMLPLPLRRIWRGLVRMTDLGGRATVIDFFFGMIVLNGIGKLLDALYAWLTQPPLGIFASYGSAVCGLFAITVIVRRLHDQGRTGWYALIALPGFALSAYKSYYWQVELRLMPELPFSYHAILVLVGIAFFGLMLLTGTDGPNRFGPDPRVIDREAATGAPVGATQTAP